MWASFPITFVANSFNCARVKLKGRELERETESSRGVVREIEREIERGTASLREIEGRRERGTKG